MKRNHLRVVVGGDAANGLCDNDQNTVATSPNATQAIEPVVGPDDISKSIGCSKRWLEQQRSAGKFPAPDVWCGRKPKWFARTVNAWLRAGGAR